MGRGKRRVIGTGFAAFRLTGLHRALAPLTRGRGAILALHRVRPAPPDGGFRPNGLLEVEPAFLDAALARIRALGFDIVALDAMMRRLAYPDKRPAIALTLDDGYCDLVEHALPILRRHRAPFTAFVAAGFADRTARLWWIELEEAVRRSDVLRVPRCGGGAVLSCRTPAEKRKAYDALYGHLRAGSEERLLTTIADLGEAAGVDAAGLVAAHCLDWDGLRRLAAEPLCTLGAHTISHPMLAKHPAGVARREMSESRRRLREETGADARFLSYPVGDATSAGPREFALAAELGFAGAVTTRPGMLFPAHAAAPHALPRVSLNGDWQSLGCLDVLLSGAPFALWNRGRLAG